MNVHAGSQQAVDLIGDHFEPGQGEKLLNQCTIKRTGDHCSVWQAECFGTAVETHAGWTVIAAAAWNAKCGKLIRDTAEGSRCSGGYLWTVHALSTDHAGEIIVGQLGDKFVHGVRAVFDIGEADALVSGERNFFRKIVLTALCLIHMRKRNIFHADHIAAPGDLRMDTVK